MTSTHADYETQPSRSSSSRRRGCGDSWNSDGKHSVWNPFNIALMVLGFIFFTPLGLVILFGLIMGISPMNLPRKIAEWFQGASEWTSSMNPRPAAGRGKSGNAVFDEYQQTQLDRIEEIRTEVKERDTQFKSFQNEEKRGKDKKQFYRFMGRDRED